MYKNLISGNSWSSGRAASNADKTTSLADRISHKEGRVRGNLLGRRTIDIARTVISCNPRIGIDDLLIPMTVAKSIFIPEIFTSYNRKRLLIYY
jgi:DNA-directed RNA polymerase beta' subunit